MPKFKIPVSWEMGGYLYIEAADMDSAIKKAESDDQPLPKGSYVEASFRVEEECIEEVP